MLIYIVGLDENYGEPGSLPQTWGPKSAVDCEKLKQNLITSNSSCNKQNKKKKLFETYNRSTNILFA